MLLGRYRPEEHPNCIAFSFAEVAGSNFVVGRRGKPVFNDGRNNINYMNSQGNAKYNSMEGMLDEKNHGYKVKR